MPVDFVLSHIDDWENSDTWKSAHKTRPFGMIAPGISSFCHSYVGRIVFGTVSDLVSKYQSTVLRNPSMKSVIGR